MQDLSPELIALFDQIRVSVHGQTLGEFFKSVEILFQFLLDQHWRIVMGDVSTKATRRLWLILQSGNQIGKPVFISRNRILGQECDELGITPCDPLVAGVAMLKILLIDLIDGNVGVTFGKGL